MDFLIVYKALLVRTFKITFGDARHYICVSTSAPSSDLSLSSAIFDSLPRRPARDVIPPPAL